MTNTTTLPQVLRFTDPGLREQLEALPEGTALIGIGTDGTAIAIDVDHAPHILICTGTGGGSTTILRTLTAQFLHQGAHALVLDGPLVAHLWTKDLPTVTHRGSVAGIHDALVGLAAELQRRLHLDGDLDDAPRLMVVLDRADDTMRHLARYWETFRQKDDPKKSPAITALEDVLHAGRQARIHVLYNGRATAGSLAPAAREQFATVILARVSAGTWQRLAPIAGPAPKSSAHPGRAHVVQDDTTHPTQLLLMTDAEAADWLTATAAGKS
ncbi:hypothetical protein MHW47_11990 [Streptomyces sp. OfavH-34-F]|uniref:hypothetical protein n=1 Tax=Streptomyces sp. OfavH-34-F TaxID=2917760 RepID=UPI001EF21B4B|nr:hypothetical protein [Streptomyces sp. OfavH-34-F]MCG7525156.1 hypothetical protein [Streptomyces sp. OfavH-34-F]